MMSPQEGRKVNPSASQAPLRAWHFSFPERSGAALSKAGDGFQPPSSWAGHVASRPSCKVACCGHLTCLTQPG